MRQHLLPAIVVILSIAVLGTVWGIAIYLRESRQPTKHVWEIQAVKPKGDQVELGPGWEILGYDRQAGVVYIKRRVE